MANRGDGLGPEEGHAAAHLSDLSDPSLLTWREVKDEFGSFTQFMLAYGLRPYDTDDCQEAVQISRSLKAMRSEDSNDFEMVNPGPQQVAPPSAVGGRGPARVPPPPATPSVADSDYRRRRFRRIALDQTHTKLIVTSCPSYDMELNSGVLVGTNHVGPDVSVIFSKSASKATDIDFELHNVPSYQLMQSVDGGLVAYAHVDNNPLLLASRIGSNYTNALWIKIGQPEADTLFGFWRCPPGSALSIPDVSSAIAKGQQELPTAKLMFVAQMSKKKWRSGVERDLKAVAQAKNLHLKAHHSKEDAVYIVIKSDFYRDSKESLKAMEGSLAQEFLTVSRKRKYCKVCKMAFNTDDELRNVHLRTDGHRRNYLGYTYHLNRRGLIEEKLGMQINLVSPKDKNQAFEDPEDRSLVTAKVVQNRPTKLVFEVRNTSDKDPKDREAHRIVESIEFVEEDPDVKLEEELPGGITMGVTKPREQRHTKVMNGVRVTGSPESNGKPSGQAFKITVTVVRRSLDQHRMILVMTFIDDSKDKETTHKRYHMAKEILIQVTNEEINSIKPVSPYKRPKYRSTFGSGGRGNLVPGVRFNFEGSGKADDILRASAKRLDQYELSRERELILTHNLRPFAGMTSAQNIDLNQVRSVLDQTMSMSNCRERLKILLQAEEAQMKRDIRAFDMTQVHMTEVKPGRLLDLVVPGLAENRPSVLKGDNIIVKQSGTQRPEYEGVVHEVRDKSIRVGFNERLRKNFIPNMSFDVQFTVNRHPLRLMYRALGLLVQEKAPLKLYFPVAGSKPDTKKTTIEVRKFYNRNIETNHEQMTAVREIVNGGLEGVPYIVFGPPGTGKTVTVVEAIKQVIKHKPGARILACAPSNAAADVLATRIKENTPDSEILRYYAPSRDDSKIPEVLKPISSLRKSTRTLEEVKAYRVVVMTLVTSGRLSLASLGQGHFTHVFVDEAGHATEPEALVAISGILGERGQLVLAGDPKQLGPVIRAPVAVRHGLATSLLERLMATNPVYAKPYNNACITKLLKNFRSHESLLSLPSRLSYDNELIASADPFVVKSLCDWEGLPTRGFPLLFHGVVGRDLRESTSPSFFNREEVVTVCDYIQKLLALKNPRLTGKDIGVISPYRKQISKIKDALNSRHQRDRSVFSNKEWKDITVASCEEFQGQERKVIIISTVRSEPSYLQEDHKHKLGFVRNPKRFNVAITRVKALLVVVGNPKLLSVDNNWREFIRYAKSGGGYTGVKFSLDDPSNDVAMRALEDKFDAWNIAETMTNTSGPGSTTQGTGFGDNTTLAIDSAASSFEQLAIGSPSPVNSDTFERLSDEDFLHEDAPGAGFHQ